LGSALTYAERYFLLKYFHIATDEDDIDNPERVTTEAIEPIVVLTDANIESSIKKGTQQKLLADIELGKFSATPEQIKNLEK